MPIAEDLLDATVCIQQYVLHALSPMPEFDRSTRNYHMGPLYDYWVTQTIRMSREAQAAMDRVKLISRESTDGARHMHRFMQILLDRFEQTLSYRTPYSPTTNPYGMVRIPLQGDTTHKLLATLVHRAISMQILVLHICRLQFLVLLTRADDSGARPLLGDTFEEKMQQAMEIAAETMSHQGDSTLQGAATQRDNENYIPFLSDIEDAMIILNSKDSTSEQCTRFMSDMLSGKEMALNLIRRALNKTDRMDLTDDPDPTVSRLWNRLLGYNSTSLDGVPADAAQLARIAIADHAASTQGPGDTNESGCLEAAMHFSTEWRTALGFSDSAEFNQDNLLWIIASSKILETFQKLSIANIVSNANKDPTDLADAQSESVPRLATNPFQNELDDILAQDETAKIIRSWGLPAMLRHFAFSSSHLICSKRPEDESFEDFVADLVRHTSDASNILSGAYAETKRDVHGFLPMWTENDREYLHTRAAQPTALSSLPFLQEHNVGGQFVYSHRRVTQHRVVRLWRRATQWTERCSNLWVLAHAETALMSDVYRLIGRLAVANREATRNRAFPHNAVQNVLAGVLERSPVAGHFNRIVDIAVQRNLLPPGIIDPIKTAYDNLLQVPAPTEQGNTTQPIPSSTKDWVLETGRILDDLLLADDGGGNPIRDTIDTIQSEFAFEKIPTVLNSTSIPTVSPPDGRTFPSSVPRPLPDRFKTDNVVAFEHPSANLYAFLVTYGSEIHKTTIGILLGSMCMRNSATLVHLSEACKALIRDWDRDQPPLLTYVNRPELRVDIILNDVSMPPELQDPDLRIAAAAAMGGGMATSSKINRLIPTSEKLVLRFINDAIDANNGEIPIMVRPTPLHRVRTLLHSHTEKLHNEYAARTAPFLFPTLWMDSLADFDHAQWTQVEQNDRIDGVLFQVPVPPPRAGAAAAAAAAPPHPPWLAAFQACLEFSHPADLE